MKFGSLEFVSDFEFEISDFHCEAVDYSLSSGERKGNLPKSLLRNPVPFTGAGGRSTSCCGKGVARGLLLDLVNPEQNQQGVSRHSFLREWRDTLLGP